MAKKGDWVQIHSIVLQPGERSANLPQDTKRVPLEMWVKGRLLANAEPGCEAAVRTRTGRIERGTLVDEAPYFTHSFGGLVPEVLEIGDSVREILFGGEDA
ncbi:MAG: 2-amino-4-oxopentanoate thiolase subunit OrtA [Clostridia bacterium]|nr:2-amino-4-oxopentanoate thiolase subunit OrtA [Clostridia bacterium]